MPAATWTPNPDVVFTKLDDEEAVLLHLKTKEYFSLNETGVLIWEQLEEKADLERIAAALAEAYAIEEAEARASARRFLSTLEERGLVHG